jgi:hypothetical protein
MYKNNAAHRSAQHTHHLRIAGYPLCDSLNTVHRLIYQIQAVYEIHDGITGLCFKYGSLGPSTTPTPGPSLGGTDDGNWEKNRLGIMA